MRSVGKKCEKKTWLHLNKTKISFPNKLLMLSQVLQPSFVQSHCCSCACMAAVICKCVSEQEEGLQALALHFVHIIMILFKRKKKVK